VDDDDVSVLADDLIERGDPCGELLSLLLARDALAVDALPARRRVIDSRIAAYLDRHHDSLYGALAPHVQRASRPDLRAPAMEIDRWLHGLVDVTLQPGGDRDLVGVMRALRAAPIGRFVRRLAIRHGADMTAARTLIREPFPALRELFFGWSSGRRSDDPFLEILAPLLPDLEVLEIQSRSAYVPFVASRLKKLTFWIDPDAPAVRFESRLDAIEHLELSDFTFPRGLLRSYPTLRHVALSGRFEPDWLEDFLTSDLGRLSTVTFFSTTFRERDLDVVVRHAARATGLAKLAVSTPWGNIPIAARDAARAVLPRNIVVE
jgi:hypothetical protein